MLNEMNKKQAFNLEDVIRKRELRELNQEIERASSGLKVFNQYTPSKEDLDTLEKIKNWKEWSKGKVDFEFKNPDKEPLVMRCLHNYINFFKLRRVE